MTYKDLMNYTGTDQYYISLKTILDPLNEIGLEVLFAEAEDKQTSILNAMAIALSNHSLKSHAHISKQPNTHNGKPFLVESFEIVYNYVGENDCDTYEKALVLAQQWGDTCPAFTDYTAQSNKDV